MFVINSTEYHVAHAAEALEHDKIVFIEKPMALSERDVESMRMYESASKGTVMVGYMRRYATAFADAVKEIGGMDQVRYATVRGIIGKNSLFTAQSGAFPKYFSDYSEEVSEDKKLAVDDLNRQGLELDLGIKVTEESATMWSLLGSLGCHDLSAMREALGMPQSVLGCSLGVGNMMWR